MDWRTIKEMRFELESRGYFIEAINDKCMVVSLLCEDNKYLYYCYPGVRDYEGKLKTFDLNLREM